MSNLLVKSFYILVVIFLVVLAQFFIPAYTDLLSGPIFLLPLGLYSLIGMWVFILAVREKKKSKLRNFMILSGVSAASFFLFVVLHNVFYAFGILWGGMRCVEFSFEALHVISFIIAVVLSPIGFIVGVIGSFIYLRKKT